MSRSTLVITSLSLNPRYNGSRYNLVKHVVKKANSTLVKKRQQIQQPIAKGRISRQTLVKLSLNLQ